MTGRRLDAFHEGDRSEYLFTFFLSSIAAVIPVPRPEDYGLDFLCALTRKEGPSLYVEKEFAVQVKSSSEEYLSYGGFDKKRQWKKWELKWLFQQSHPFFIASVDRDTWNVKMYATCRKWFIQWMIGNPFEIRFTFEELPETGQYRFPNQQIEKTTEDMGNATSYTIPLGKPIIEIDYSRLVESDFREKLYACIDRWIEAERKNIQNYMLRVPLSFEFIQWDTNQVPEGNMVTMGPNNNFRPYAYFNATEGWNIEPALAAMVGPAFDMALNAASQGNREAVKTVEPLLTYLINRNFIDSSMLDRVMILLDNRSQSNESGQKGGSGVR